MARFQRLPVYREASMEGGISVCGIRFFKNIQVQYLISKYGLIKIFEIFAVLFCEKVVYDVGKVEHRKPIKDNVYLVFTTVTNMALMQAFTFIVIYIFSAKTFQLVRSSILEIVSNVLLMMGFLAAVLFIAIKAGFFADPMRFLTGRENETNETILYVSKFCVPLYEACK